MDQFVRYLVSLLVEEPDQIEVKPRMAGQTKIYQVYVAQKDLGKVIGRRGRTAGALRAVVESASRKFNERATVDIVS